MSILVSLESLARKYHLPSLSTEENLELCWRKVLNYGDKVLLAGYYYEYGNAHEYFGAVYEYLSDDHTCEGKIGLRFISDLAFYDAGHAIEWAMKEAVK